MARVCEFCGKRTRVGNRVAWRGKPKAQGGVGLKVHGRNKRRFKANVQVVRAEINGSVKRVKICTQCLRSGKIKKAPR